MLSDGTSQRDRQTPTLYPGFINVDELSFEQLLATAAGYARLLQFFNLENEPERDWEPFFTSDEAVILALILTTNLGQVETDFLDGLPRNISRFGPEYDLKDLANYGLALQLDFWLTRLQLNQSSVGGALEKRIAEAVVNNLRHELLSLGAFFRQYDIDVEERFRQDFSRIWFGSGAADWSSYPVPPPSSYPDSIERFLRRNFHAFYNTVRSLQSRSASLLPDSLTSGNHAPDTGLYIAFLRLFQQAQERVNRFTQQHLDFYYREVLKVQARPATPDSVYLVLSTDLPERQVLLREGTEFTAGVDQNNRYVIYGADRDVLIHGAQVAELSTLHFEHDPLSSPEHELDFSSGAKTHRIPLDQGTSGPDNNGGPTAWPLFGAAKTDADEEPGEEARLGFALASPALYLQEGERWVSVNFDLAFRDYRPFTEADLRDPSELLTRLQQPADPVSQYLREQLPPEARDLVDAYRTATPPSPELLQALVSELNRLLLGDSLYEPQRFQQVNLDRRTRERLAEDLSDLDRLRLNRALLEEAYPEILARTVNLDYLLERLADLLLDSSPQDAFFKTFRQMFTIHLTAATGWYQVPEYLPLGRVVDDDCPESVLKFQFRLSSEAPAVVGYSSQLHGGGYDTELPVIRFVINPAAYLYPYSLLMQLQIREIDIEVEVQGVRDLALANNLGPLDPSSPFNPFGPTPAVGSYLVVGNAEAARKQVTHFDVTLEWGDLPTTGLDFTDYYQGYGMAFYNYLFEARVSALQDGRWQPADETRQWTVKLFEDTEEDGTEPGAAPGGWTSVKFIRWSLGDAVTRFFTPADATATASGLPYNARSKNGFFKFTLSGPEYAFGHKEYPLRLSSVLSSNALLKKADELQPVPNPPYTPLINAISVNYRAVASFNLLQGASATEGATAAKIFHLHPHGLETIAPDRYRTLNMVPQYADTGNLFIGISAPALSGPLTLFFHLQEDCFPEAANEYLGIAWHYLASNQWRQLSRSQVISDTTGGFLTSGVVTLDLPRDINRDNTVLPGDRFWLRVSVVNHPEALCSLYSVYTQALKVTRQLREGDAPQSGRLPAGTITEPRVSLPGIVAINQVVDSFGGSPPETFPRTVSRVSERLRHKNRAVTPWDYERLVLERFPEIFKVKCFANLVAESGQENLTRPGHVSIVVIPDPRQQPSVHLKPLVDGLTLREIQEYVSAHASPFVSITVRNPAYEEIQVRCTAKFRPGSGEGYYIRALNRAITDYISPWSDTGGYGAEFGWTMRRHEIESYIRSLDYVDFVTNFSMLRISVDDQNYYRLYDTVPGDSGEAPGVDEVRPRYPWSIAVPTHRHFIETTDRYVVIPPEPTGIDELEIGSTFIITEK